MEKTIGTLSRKSEALTSKVQRDEFIAASERAFDCKFNGQSQFTPWQLPNDFPKDFRIGVIYGASGSGKSTLLKEFGSEIYPVWESDKAIVSHFESPDEAINKLGAVGLNSIPSWYKPYHVLSTGEKFRADLARKIRNGAVIDEFTSVVDRTVAKAASVAISKYINNNDIKNVVLATCHEDIIDWLQPDWVINTNNGEIYDGFFLSVQKSISKYIVESAVCGPCLKTIII